jgi:hypothetical protein
MQADLSGNYLFIYSGRAPKTMNLETKKLVYKMDDPFSEVKIIRIDKISSVDINYKEQNLKIYVDGMYHPIYCSFGERNCYRINCFYEFVDIIQKAMNYDFTKGFDMEKRSSQTALSVQPSDIRDEEYLDDRTSGFDS